MDDDFGIITEDQFVSYGKRTNEANYNNRHNNSNSDRNKNLWYKLDNGSYVSVSVEVEPGDATYAEITERRNNSWYENNVNNLYALVNGVPQKVTIEKTGNLFVTYVYKLPDGTEIAQSSGRNSVPVFNKVDKNRLCLLTTDNSKNIYTYIYTDADNVTHEIGTASTGADTVFETAFYEKTTAGSTITRLEALTNALNNFVSDVNDKAAGPDGDINTTDDNVNHRVAIVGFASDGDNYNNDKYENTELFVGETQYRYNQGASEHYGEAFQSMDTTLGRANIQSSIANLDAYGGTRPCWGIEMANGIFNAYPIQSGEKRNRVVIIFTDGEPGSGSTFNNSEANKAIAEVHSSKDIYQATAYTVGIFSGANATVPMPDNTNNANKFMHYMSSNFEYAQSMTNFGNSTYPEDGSSYYLSAADSESLNNIFKQISNQIESGTSSSKLTEEAVIKDIISEQFQLPEKATENSIHLYTEDYTADKTFTNQQPFEGTVDVNGSNVSVSGFDFSDNWCGTESNNGNTTYRGKKLIIEFTVEAKDGFLGGNNVYTNTSAGVYENNSAEQPIQEFERPQVNVPIKDITVGAVDKNVYLLNGLTAEELRSGATAKVGNVTLDLTQPAQNYGLKDWQTAGVDISVTITDADRNVVSTDLTNLREDTTYNVTVQVSPKETALTTSSGTAAATQSDTDEGSINVFKPELSFKDSQVYYGDTVPTDFTGNLTATKWKHNGTEADTSKMGEAPALTLNYTPDETKIADGIINTKEDIPVKATVSIVKQNDAGQDVTAEITDKTTFIHTACSPACGWTEPITKGNPAFLLHPKTCQLTITKTGGAAGEPYVFDVYKDGAKYSEVTIVGNTSETICELPVGTYRIEEKTDWSWRYNPSYNGSVTLSKDVTSGTITCTNTNNNNKWLNGYSDVIKNIFGVAN